MFFGHFDLKFSIRVLLSFSLIFANLSLVLLIKVLLVIKNECNELNLDLEPVSSHIIPPISNARMFTRV